MPTADATASTPSRGRPWVWTAGYALAVTLPLAVIAVAGAAPEGWAWRAALSAASGYLAFTLVALQIGLVNRLPGPSRILGSDALMSLHRGMGALAVACLVAHVLLLPPAAGLLTTWPQVGPLGAGVAAWWIVLAVVLTSVIRRGLRLPYEIWQAIHVTGATAAVALAAWHALGVGSLGAAPAVRGMAAGYAAAFGFLIVRHRGWRPYRLARSPWLVAENAQVGGRTRLLRIKPDGHAGLAFRPGQFAWLVTGRSPFWAQQHPLSIASAPASAPDGAVEFLIKALGDWSRDTVGALAPGDRVWVDGPYGHLTPRDPGARLVLLAGGIGIAPMRSVLGAMAADRSTRPVTLIYAASSAAMAPSLEELRALARALPWEIVPVFETGEAGAGTESGFVSADLIRRRVPAPLAAHEYLICGPLPMIDAVVSALTTLSVPHDRITTERFHMV